MVVVMVDVGGLQRGSDGQEGIATSQLLLLPVGATWSRT